MFTFSLNYKINRKPVAQDEWILNVIRECFIDSLAKKFTPEEINLIAANSNVSRLTDTVKVDTKDFPEYLKKKLEDLRPKKDLASDVKTDKVAA